MTKRVFIIHGWGGNPDEAWMPWLKKKLEKKNIEVYSLPMPNAENPTIGEWVSFLSEQVGEPDKNTYFIGGSIGCQTILRYLETLEDKKVGGAVFVAGWFNLKGLDEEDIEIAKPWIETPINFEKILKTTNKFAAIFSDNDPYVPIEDSEIFKEKLGAKIIIEHNKGHFSGEDNITELPIALEELVKIIK